MPVMAEAPDDQRIVALLSEKGITYKNLNQTCINAGLPPNTYPPPPVSDTFKAPGNPDIEQIRGGSLYFTLNHLTIGEQDYTSGVACNSYDGLQARQQNGMVIHHFNMTLYVGQLGDMENGFQGWVQMKVYGWNTTARTIDYATWHCTLIGFGDFKGQTLVLTCEAASLAEFMAGGSATNPWTGYCNKE